MKSRVLITGGAGFIGTNVAKRLLSLGSEVTVFDDLSRPGVENNLRWLQGTFPGLVKAINGDVRDRAALDAAVVDASAVFHFAAQVAVTTSLVDPTRDFQVNALGTVNLLEALRALPVPPPLVFTSTNKVYGGLEDVSLRVRGDRYEPVDAVTRASGIGETRALDFHSPYGCSKGAADQYVVDYARTYGLPAVVFRMSCIYGPHQHGTEDQGWVAHFLIQSMRGQEITVFGDGRQVRDVLFVEDLVDAFQAAVENIEALSGQAFNIGGGPDNTTSLLELIALIGELDGSRPTLRLEGWRPGDQRYYVTNTSKFTASTGWMPRVGVREGVGRLHQWLGGLPSREPVATQGPRQ